jgi:PTH2 family peptidyl-tRNA hydrolase
MSFTYKQAIVVRQDLGMSKGKTAAQAAHASISSFLVARERRPEWCQAWLAEGQKKVILKVTSADDLLELKRKAEVERIPNAIIADAGLTELEPGTITCLGLGPAPNAVIDKVTGSLRLL